MSIRLIAVDMDGTFLDANKKYNQQRFLAQYQKLKQKNIHFVVASGNPLYTLQAYFPEIAHDLAFVAENGAYIVNQDQDVYYRSFDSHALEAMLAILLPEFGQRLILCAKDCAYIQHDVSEEILKKLKIYFKNIKKVEDLTKVQAPILKVTVSVIEQDHDLVKFLNQHEQITDNTKVVSSGFGFIDMIIPQQHKAFGLSLLQDLWNVSDAEILAIGDNYNDIEMLKKAKYSVAMDNAVDEVKKLARYIARDNNQEGVLDVLDIVLQDEQLLDHWSSKYLSLKSLDHASN